MQKNVYLLILVLITLSIGFFLGQTKQTSAAQKSQADNRNLDKMVIESFSLGCEVGMAIYCDPQNLMECKKKCFTFLKTNPKVLEALKKKPEVTLEKMKKETKSKSFLSF